jgi:uncharacterized protein YbaA (DUF1428 family)
MFTSVYFCRVPLQNRTQFLEIQRKAAAIYVRHGAIGDWTFGPDNLDSKYGCSSFLTEITTQRGEELFFSLSLFHSRADHDRIMATVDNDPEIAELYLAIGKAIDLSRVIRGEFNRLI